MRLFFLQEKLTYHFTRLGGFIARHPIYFIILPVILSAVLSTGIFYIRINRDVYKLVTTADGKAEESKRILDHLFPMNTSWYFDMLRATNINQFISIIIIAKDEGSMLRKNIFEEIKYLDKILRNLTIWFNGIPFNYSDVCGKRFGECTGNDIIGLAPYLREIIDGKYNARYPVHFYNLTTEYDEYAQSAGGVKLDDKGYIRDIKAIRLIYATDVTNRSKIRAIEKWQNAVSQLLKKTIFQSIYFSFLSQEAVHEGFMNYSTTLIQRAPITVLILLIFSFFTCLTNDWVRSKQWLGPSACISAGLAIASSFGLSFYMGIDYVDYTILLCYTVLVTEIDDAFILISSWRNTDPKDSVETRMAETYSESAISITITSLTNIVSFCVGISSSTPSFKIGCIYGALSCCFAYIYLITFFGGCMALSGYREEKKLHPFTFRVIKEITSVNHSRDKLFSSRLQKSLEALIMLDLFKTFIGLIFLGLLAVGCWGASIMKLGTIFHYENVGESSTAQGFQHMYKYFGNYTFPVQIILKYDMNYADSSVQNSIEKMLDEFKECQHIAESDIHLSWLKHYKQFQQHNIGKILLSGFNMSNEQDFIYALKFIFLKLPMCRHYEQDIHFNDDFTKILASRFILPMKDIYGIESEFEAMKELYDIAGKASIPVDIFGLTFQLHEPSLMIKRQVIILVLSTSCLMCVIFLLFVPNIPCALGLSVVVLCSIIETAGLSSLWNIRLDFISLHSFLYAVGLCVNYPAHMAFVFLMGRRNGIRKDFYALAYPILQGCSCSVLGMLAIAFHTHYISQCGFKFIFAIASITAFHALFSIPVFLNILGLCFKSMSIPDEVLCAKQRLGKEEKFQQPLTNDCSFDE